MRRAARCQVKTNLLGQSSEWRGRTAGDTYLTIIDCDPLESPAPVPDTINGSIGVVDSDVSDSESGTRKMEEYKK